MPISVNIEAEQTREGVTLRPCSALDPIYADKMKQDPLKDFHTRLYDQKR